MQEKDYEINRLINIIHRKTDRFYEEHNALIKENELLKREKSQTNDIMKSIREEELSKIPTCELMNELSQRMSGLNKLEHNHNKLLDKHKKAAVMIADLKK